MYVNYALLQAFRLMVLVLKTSTSMFGVDGTKTPVQCQ